MDAFKRAYRARAGNHAFNLFLKDITAVLQALGCSVRRNPLLGPSVTPDPFIIGDGGLTEYRVRLTLNGRTVDEAEFKVSYGFG
jgi:uroporphyrinogen-III decarboxylase